MTDNMDIWFPPPRSTVTGHRISLDPDWEPVSTRHLNWRWWLSEWAMRVLARSMRNDPTVTHYSGDTKVGERSVGFHMSTIHFGTEIHEAMERHYQNDNPE